MRISTVDSGAASAALRRRAVWGLEVVLFMLPALKHKIWQHWNRKAAA